MRSTSLIAAFPVLALVCLSAAAGEKPYKPRRLSDGHPDLQGVWINSNMTPLTRPQGVDSFVISAAQAAELQVKLNAPFEDPKVPNEPTEFYDARAIEPIRGERRSSLLVDPADGKLPATPLFTQKLIAAFKGMMTNADGPEQRPLSERCITSPAGQPPIVSVPSNNLHQIIQTRDAILFFAEALHDARIIRMNATHAPPAVTTILGDSIGHWEGDTLVVETTNFSPSTQERLVPQAAFFVSPQARVTERITRVSQDELQYEFAVEDPVHYTRPWRAESHFLRSTEPMYEYACHEGNYSLTNVLAGGRARD